MKKTDDAGLMQALDYILNRAGLREIDALEAAVERRRKEISAETGIVSLDPERAAKEMTGAVNSSIDRTMDAVRDTLRGLAFDLLDKEALELSESEKEKLVDSWMPQRKERPDLHEGGFAAKYPPLAESGKVNGIPCDMMKAMVMQFVAYSLGEMPPSDEAALRRDVGNWPATYWHRFPPQLQQLIKSFLSGKCSRKEFDAALSVMVQDFPATSL